LKKIATLRMQNNWSQSKLAELLGVNQVAVCYWERGERIPSYKTVQKIASIFGVTTSCLLGETRGDGCDEVVTNNAEQKT